VHCTDQSVESSGVKEGGPLRTPVAVGLIIIIKPITLADFALVVGWIWKWN